jgi:hypothetical protein
LLQCLCQRKETRRTSQGGVGTIAVVLHPLSASEGPRIRILVCWLCVTGVHRITGILRTEYFAAAGRARARCSHSHSGIRAEGRGRPPGAARLGCPRRARCGWLRRAAQALRHRRSAASMAPWADLGPEKGFPDWPGGSFLGESASVHFLD